MATESTELSVTESRRLKECETVIELGIKTFVEVGNALLEIRDKRLYRANLTEDGTPMTFEAYCQERWGFSRMHAGRMIAAAEVAENVTHGLQIDPPATERQARPLTRLPAADQPAAWQQATERAAEAGRAVTGADVEKVVTERIERTTTTRGSKTGAPKVTADDDAAARSKAMDIAHDAIRRLNAIKIDDPMRVEALALVVRWCRDHE